MIHLRLNRIEASFQGTALFLVSWSWFLSTVHVPLDGTGRGVHVARQRMNGQLWGALPAPSSSNQNVSYTVYILSFSNRFLVENGL